MTFNEFWKLYHREDPGEALNNPHELMIYLKDGSKHKGYMPGSLLAGFNGLHIGTGFKRDGSHKSSFHVTWSEIEKVVPITQRAGARKRDLRKYVVCA